MADKYKLKHIIEDIGYLPYLVVLCLGSATTALALAGKISGSNFGFFGWLGVATIIAVFVAFSVRFFVVFSHNRIVKAELKKLPTNSRENIIARYKGKLGRRMSLYSLAMLILLCLLVFLVVFFSIVSIEIMFAVLLIMLSLLGGVLFHAYITSAYGYNAVKDSTDVTKKSGILVHAGLYSSKDITYGLHKVMSMVFYVEEDDNFTTAFINYDILSPYPSTLDRSKIELHIEDEEIFLSRLPEEYTTSEIEVFNERPKFCKYAVATNIMSDVLPEDSENDINKIKELL